MVWLQPFWNKLKYKLCMLCTPSQSPVLFENMCQWMQIYPLEGRYTSKHACFNPFQECSCKIPPVNLMAGQQVLTKVVDLNGNIAYHTIHAQKKWACHLNLWMIHFVYSSFFNNLSSQLFTIKSLSNHPPFCMMSDHRNPGKWNDPRQKRFELLLPGGNRGWWDGSMGRPHKTLRCSQTLQLKKNNWWLEYEVMFLFGASQ